MKSVVSYGGGTNSTAVLAGMVGNKEQIDAIVFADTGGEKPHTYEYINVLSEWLESKSYPPIHIVKAENRHGTLERECLNMNTLPAIAFGFKSCSDKWKIQPFRKWLKKTGWDDVTVAVGFDAGESHRAKRGDESKESYKKRYPLIEWGMYREDCVKMISDAGLPQPGKSACFFCPSSKKHEILSLPKDLRDRAIAMENNATRAMAVKGLGRNWSWRDMIKADEDQFFMFTEAAMEQPCGCYDGESS